MAPSKIIHCVSTPEGGIFIGRDEQEAHDYVEYREMEDLSNAMAELDQEDQAYQEDDDEFDPNNDEDSLPASYFSK